MKQMFRRLPLFLLFAAVALTAMPAAAQTYTSINIQSTGSPTSTMYWSGEDTVELRVTLWFPAGSPCESASVVMTIKKGTKTPTQAAKDLADIIRDVWPGIEVVNKGRTVTVWGTDPDQVEGTPDEPKVQTTGTRKSAPRVSYFTHSL